MLVFGFERGFVMGMDDFCDENGYFALSCLL